MKLLYTARVIFPGVVVLWTLITEFYVCSKEGYCQMSEKVDAGTGHSEDQVAIEEVPNSLPHPG